MYGADGPATVAMRPRLPKRVDTCRALMKMSTGCERAWRRFVRLLA